MNYDICPTCHQFGNMAHHICPPIWEVRPEDWEKGDTVEVRAPTPKEAACLFAEHDLSDSSMMGEGEWVVFVRPFSEPRAEKRYQVNMEMEPVFSAKELS